MVCIGSVYAQDTTLHFPISPIYDPTQTQPQSFDLGDPTSVTPSIVYDPITGTYVFTESIGNNLNYRNPSLMTFEEYIEYERQKGLKDNWKDMIDAQTEENQPFELPIKVGSKLFENFFGSDQITIRPQGTVELTFGVNSSRYDNPILPVKQRKITRFDFQQQIQMNLVGQIGTKLKIGTSYNTQAAFDFDNKQKLEYVGNEDQIIQKIGLGNVTMELPTSLIPSSQTLFGATTKLRFGKTTLDIIAASSKGKRQEINISGKAQIQQFELGADDYEANRHYFVNMYYRDHYNESMSTLPIANTTINITRMEVWMTNRTNSIENTRNFVAFSDMGEAIQTNCQGDPGGYSSSDLPDNDANGLYNWAATNPNIRSFVNAVSTLSSQIVSPGPFNQGAHYEKVQNARKLTEQEFSYNAQMGFISLNLPLNNDEVLAVAYEYTYRGETYQVGEFSTDGVSGQDAIILKLLKATITNPKNKIWDLMMKNVYSIGAYQVDQVGFRMDILYNNPDNSILMPLIPIPGVDDKQLVTILDMDKINQTQQLFSDGVFDFVPIVFNDNRAENAGTINTRNGRVYFSTIEPFGATLASKLANANPPIPNVIIDRIAYTELYDSTKTAAQQIPSKNRFSFKGEYQSSISSDIPLNALNVPEGAVTVTAGGIKLVEGTDFTVDYNLGRVKILNSGILESNTPIKISIESNSVFGFQAKSLVGSRVSHRFGNRLNVGATWMRMMERPVTQKVDIGSEPYKNNVVGFDLQYNTDVPFVTKLVDWIPGLSTKAKSTFSFQGEFAHIIPGSPKAINKDGTSYVDDFEGAQSSIDLKSFTAWKLASVPQGQTDLFPEAFKKNLSSGYNRAGSHWYVIDPLFYQSNSQTPQHIKDNPEQLSDSRMRLVSSIEIFPNQSLPYGSLPNVSLLELAYYPKERGMYNYDTSASVNADGTFVDPENRWGGIMRSLSTNNFEQTNIEYIQFWLLDPFNEDAENVDPNADHNGGDLYFNLGNVSEDVLPDSRKSFENGLPPSGTSLNNDIDVTEWARVSTQQVVVNAFDTDPSARVNQDVGLDGWNNTQERVAFLDYVSWVEGNSLLSAEAKSKMISDPSGDDYNYYRDDVYDTDELNILERYKAYNGMEGNSYTTEMSDTANADGYPTMGSNNPDVEDLNQDNNLSETESYYQYKISMRPEDMVVGQNFITSVQTFTSGTKTENWYQFKVPIRDYSKKVNGISDFRSIRFMRMFMKGFDEEVVLRFARLEFVRGEWRRYFDDLTEPGESVQVDPNLTTFNVGTVNIQENEQRSPIKYVIPPGIVREVDPSQTYQRQLNEQSLTFEVCNLQDGDARAAYKNVQFDVRAYKKLKMYVHAEAIQDAATALNDEDLTVFVRLGTDFTDNYYEYEIPLKKTEFGSIIDTDIWPEENNIEIVFDDLLKLKLSRNDQIAAGSLGISTVNEYEKYLSGENLSVGANAVLIKVKGNPNLQGIKTIMIGVRNPHKKSHKLESWREDGLPKCANIWVNELRLTDFVTDGGSAAVAQMRLQAADFANINMSGNYSGINWGAVDSRVQERQRNERIGFDMNANVQLGQFFGKKAKVSLPFFYGYSMGVINPEYDPSNKDIKLSDVTDLNERKRLAKLGQDFTERKSYNFTNIRKEIKAGAKPSFWRVSNWTANFAYTENFARDYNTAGNRTKTWGGGLNYSYSFNAKPVTPFAKVKFLKKSKWLAVVRDFNFYLKPKNISFTNDLLRSYNEREIRNNMLPDYDFASVFVKQFTWNRTYNLGYDITRKLKFQFSANNRSIFLENDPGGVDRRDYPAGYQHFKDTVADQLKNLGTTMDYTHNYSFSYAVPFEKIPLTDWITGNIKYSGTYNWQRAPISQKDYGNVVQNSRNINVTAQANLTSLYNKIPWLNKVNSDGKDSGRGRPGSISAIKAGSDGGNAATPKPKLTLEPPQPVDSMTPKELRKWERELKRFERKQEREEIRQSKRKGKVHPVAGFGARMLMSVRNVSGTYNLTNGTLLPGYNQEVGALGFNPQFSSGMSGFIFGQQRYNMFGKDSGYDAARNAMDNNWLVQNENLNKQYVNSHNQSLQLRANLEPIKDMSVEITFNRTYSNNSSEFFRWNSADSEFQSQSRVNISTLTYSNVSLSSAFATIGKEFQSEVFTDMLNKRVEVSGILGANNHSNPTKLASGFYDGYSGSQQEVVMGAFLTSYSNRKVNENNIDAIKNTPLPNWSINYNGLKNFEFMKKHLKNFVIRHAYSSTVSVSGMQTNLNAELFEGNDNSPTSRDLNNNFISGMQVQNVSISERFSPLIGLDATWLIKSKGNSQGLITKFEYKKDRNAVLSLNNNQVTEILGNEWVIGSGYKFSEVQLPFKKVKPNDLTLRADISFRDNLTVIRKVVENTNQATAGQRVISIKTSADYSFTKNLVVSFYYDQTLNTPKVTTSYPTGNLSTGIKIRFNLAGVQ